MAIVSGSPFLVWLLSPFLPLVIPCILLFLIRKLWYEYNVRTKDPTCPLPLPDGTMGWPLVGETPLMAMQGYTKFVDTRIGQYGRLFKTHIFGRPTIRVWGAENIRKVLMGEMDIVQSNWPKSTNMLLGPQGLTQSQGQYHANLRHHVTAAFATPALSGYIPLIRDPIQETISNWCTQESVLVYPECRRLTFRVAARVLCGFDYSKDEMYQLCSTFEAILEALLSLPYDIPGFGLNKGMKARQLIFDKIAEQVKHVQQDIKDGRHNPTALRILMDEMIKEAEDGKVSTSQIQETIVDLMVAGFESMGSATTTLFLELFKNPEVLQNVRDELQANGLDAPGCNMNYDDIQKLKYLNCVVKEALRMCPPIGGGFRKALKTFELDGKQIPEGWAILLSYRDTVKYLDIYTEKETFDPARFSEDRAEDRKGDRFNYCVFGGGRRSCVGKPFALLILKVLVIELAQNVNWKVLNSDKVHFKMFPVPHPVGGMPVQFRRLQDQNSNSMKSAVPDVISKSELTAESLQTLIAA